MNVFDTTLLITLVIGILIVLIVYSLFFAKDGLTKSAQSQSESLKSMLDEYAQKVQSVECTIDEKFSSIDETIPTKQYAPYNNARAVDEMALSQEDADAFVSDLIKAIEDEIPALEAGIMTQDYLVIEEIVHTITGSASTLGSGGISSAFISFYAAVQHRDSFQKLYVHLQNVKYYLNELHEQFSINVSKADTKDATPSTI